MISGSFLEKGHQTKAEHDTLTIAFLPRMENVPPFPNPEYKSKKFIFSLDNIRKDLNDKTVAFNRGISVDELMIKRKNLVSSLCQDINDSSQYEDYIAKKVNEISQESDSGILVSVILPNGSRIKRLFAPTERGETVYFWCAAESSMIEDSSYIGSFVLVHAGGQELIPSSAITDQTEKTEILLNTRILH